MALHLVLAFLGLVIYNNYTDGRHIDLLVCGSNYAVYDPLRQECIDGQVTDIKTNKSNLENITHVHLDAKPDQRQTCRCCKLDVFMRHLPDARCQHAANNDKFFQRQRLSIDHKICLEANYVFRIEILQQINGQYMKARVGYWAWTPPEINGKINMRKSPMREESKHIKLDQCSPMRKNLTGKFFLLFSIRQYLNDAVIYLRQGDFVYKCPKSRRRMIRKLKKIYRKCKHSYK